LKRTRKQPLSTQLDKRIKILPKKKPEYDGDASVPISTGSTLLNLAISGGRTRGGGIPSGIIVEIFGLESTGKTVLLCEIAGRVQQAGGKILFHDPEARLDRQFARIFKLDTDEMTYMNPNTVVEVFTEVRKWIPDNDKVNCVVTDSLAALSTEMEMENDDGDKMGMRRAKDFSEQLRKTARLITKNKLLLVCSNQLRESTDKYVKYKAPGGRAIAFYSSLRLRTKKLGNVYREVTIGNKKRKQTYAIEIEVEVVKSSVWHPHRTAPVTIDFKYGIDDIRENLKFLKEYTGAHTYSFGDHKLSNSLDKAIRIVEQRDLEDELQNRVIDLWEDVEEQFKVERKPKK